MRQFDNNEMITLLRAAVRASREAFESLDLVRKCVDDADSESATEAAVLRQRTLQLSDELAKELLSREEAASTAGWF